MYKCGLCRSMVLGCLSVCLSVRLSHSYIVSKQWKLLTSQSKAHCCWCWRWDEMRWSVLVCYLSPQLAADVCLASSQLERSVSIGTSWQHRWAVTGYWWIHCRLQWLCSNGEVGSTSRGIDCIYICYDLIHNSHVIWTNFSFQPNLSQLVAVDFPFHVAESVCSVGPGTDQNFSYPP